MKPRCPTCGCAYSTWTREMLLAAAQAWAEKHGRTPKSTDWETTSAEHPHRRSPERVFGSWPAFIEAAGLPPRKPRWTRELILEALLKWRFEHGRLPRDEDWMTGSDEHPNRYMVKWHFGSWNGMLVAGGYDPVKPRRSKKSYRATTAAATKANNETAATE